MGFKLVVDVDDNGSAKVKKFNNNVEKTGKVSDKAAKMTRLFSQGIAVAGGAAVAGSAALFTLAKQTAEAQDKITKMGRELGVSTEFLSAMQFSAKLAGTSLETMDKGLARLSKTAVDAQNGSALAKRAFDDLGLAVKNNDGTFKDSDQLLFEISDKFKKMPDGVLKTAKAQELFGKSGKQMINLLNQGSDALKDQAAEAAKLGIVFDEETGNKAEEFNDQLLRIEQTFQGLAMEVGTDLIPIITELFDDILFSVENARPEIESFFDGMITFARFTVDELSELALGWSQITKEMADFASENEDLVENTLEAMTIAFDATLIPLKTLMGDLEAIPDLLSDIANLFGEVIDDTNKVGKAQKEVNHGLFDELETRKENTREAEKAAKRAERLRQSKELARRKAAKIAAKEAERVRKAETKEFEKSREAYEKSLAKKADDDARAEDDRLKKQIEVNKELTLAIMEESDRRKAIAEQEHQERLELGADEFNSRVLLEKELTNISIDEENRRFENRQRNMQSIAEGFGQASQVLNNLAQAEENKINARFDKRRENIEKTSDAEINAAEGNAARQEQLRQERDEKLKQLDLKRDRETRAANKKTAGLRKTVAIGEAVSNGALAVTRAWAEGGPFAGPILAGLAGAVTASQVALISSQKFFEGGMIKGKDTRMISTNENGTESILNARATSAVGEDALSDFNSGRTQDALDKIQSSIGGATQGSLVLNIQGGVIDRKFMQEQLLPAINKEMRRR